MKYQVKKSSANRTLSKKSVYPYILFFYHKFIFTYSYEIENCSVIWAIKDESINNAFVDAAAGKFFLKKLDERKQENKTLKRMKYTVTGKNCFLYNFTVYIFT